MLSLTATGTPQSGASGLSIDNASASATAAFPTKTDEQARIGKGADAFVAASNCLRRRDGAAAMGSDDLVDGDPAAIAKLSISK